MRLNPFYPDQYLWHLGGAYYNLHRYEEAIHAIAEHAEPDGRPAAAGRELCAARADGRRRASMPRRCSRRIRTSRVERWASVQPDRYETDVAHFVEGLREGRAPWTSVARLSAPA